MKKENIPLIIGLCIPILMIIIIAASIYVPTFFAPEPAYDFIYATWQHNYPSHNYYVSDGKIVQDNSPPPYENYKGNLSSVKLYVYNINNGQSQEISFEEAKKYKLDANDTSPDGFKITHGSYDYDPFFFGSRNYGTIYIKGHHISKKLNIKDRPNYYWRNFDFIGWIIEK
jgi:hypothetical protein